MNSSTKIKRRFLRFGLIELLLVTGVVAAWLPTFVAMRQIPELEAEAQLYRIYTTDVERLDPNQLCLRKIQHISHGSAAWKYYLPTGANMQIRLATEQISKYTLPSRYDAVKLPEGEHRIDLREYEDADGDYVKQVYVDDEIVLTSRHPKSWVDNDGSSWSTSITTRSEAYPLTEPLVLKSARYRSQGFVGKGNRTRYMLPDEYDAKGCCLWIAPTDHVNLPAPNFVSPKMLTFNENYWGNREGIRIGDFNSPDSPGLINVLAGFKVRIANPAQSSNSISVRPIIAKTSDANSGNQKPELPEVQRSYVNRGPGLRIGLSKALDSPPSDNPSPLEQRRSLGEISQDGKTMRIFCHYEYVSSGFPSGARPVIETIFDADHPNRIGLLPHQAVGSQPIQAIQIVTTMDARFRRRDMDLIVEGGEVKTVSLRQQEKSAAKYIGQSDSEAEAGDRSKNAWQTISLQQIPIDPSAQMRKLKFSTDVKDFTTAKLPPAVDPKWLYQGVRNCQTWWLPLSDTSGPANADFKVEILPTDTLPSDQTPPSPIAIPGGPVIKSVRITIPMPATKPIWLEIAPDPQNE